MEVKISEAYPKTKEKLPCGRDLFIIFNRRSHSGTEKTEDLIRFCGKNGIKADFFEVGKSKSPQEIVSEIITKSENPFLVVIGGDGTHSSIASALIESGEQDIPTVFLPAGGGQDISALSKHNRSRIEEVLLRKDIEIEKVDALKISVIEPTGSETKRYGVAHIGFGITAKTAEEINRLRPKMVGRVFIGVKNTIDSNKFRVKIGGREEAYSDIIVGNGPTSGKFLKMNSLPNDQKFDLFFIEGNAAQLAKTGIAAALRPESGKRRERIDLELMDQVTPQVDGEQMKTLPPGTKISIEVAKGVLPILKQSQ